MRAITNGEYTLFIPTHVITLLLAMPKNNFNILMLYSKRHPKDKFSFQKARTNRREGHFCAKNVYYVYQDGKVAYFSCDLIHKNRNRKIKGRFYIADADKLYVGFSEKEPLKNQ